MFPMLTVCTGINALTTTYWFDVVQVLDTQVVGYKHTDSLVPRPFYPSVCRLAVLMWGWPGRIDHMQ